MQVSDWYCSLRQHILLHCSWKQYKTDLNYILIVRRPNSFKKSITFDKLTEESQQRVLTRAKFRLMACWCWWHSGFRGRITQWSCLWSINVRFVKLRVWRRANKWIEFRRFAWLFGEMTTNWQRYRICQYLTAEAKDLRRPFKSCNCFRINCSWRK